MSINKKYSFILLSGGTGSRMNNTVPKQYMMLCGKPVIMHTLERIDEIDEIDEIIIVCQKEYEPVIDGYVENFHLKKCIRYACAGASRQESVYNGLKATKNNDVIVHEAARPLVKKSEFEDLIHAPETNITYGYPISFTVLACEDKVITGVLQRDKLVNIQLPQKFERNKLLMAHEAARKENKFFTEDAGLLYHYTGERISILTGKDYNVKMTTPADLTIGERLYKEYILGR